MPIQQDETALFTSEQRRFRRLEVSLPVWIGREDDLRMPDPAVGSPWSLGYTRDVSMGGSKIIVPPGEERKWMAARQDGVPVLIRFDTDDGIEHDEYIQGRVRFASLDKQNGGFALGVEYDEGAHEAKAGSLRAGLKTVKTRRRWQGMFVLALTVIGLAAVLIQQQRTSIAAQQARIFQLQKQRKQLDGQLSRLSRVGLVGTRAEGINLAYQRKDVQAKLRQLQQNMARFSNDKNQSLGERARARLREQEGVQISSASTAGQKVQMGVALPYGYAWPVVVGDLEQALGRRIPLVVIFRDWKAGFPIEDAREARVRAKTLQITWEPWHFSNPKAIKLQDIIAGKHDKYIDSWAQASQAFGSEIWIRWGHEFNGNWYPWSIVNNGQNAKTYIAAYRHVRDRFTRAGAFNVRWIWCLNAESVPNVGWNDPVRAYPGDAYVDMISIDGYNFGTALPSSRWLSFGEVFAIPYDKVTRKFPNKPVMIGEVGCASVGGDKEAWIRDMDKQLRGPFRKIQGVVWFEAAKEADWRMVSSPDVIAASRAMWAKPHFRRGES
jgi:hypothetical protein